MNSFYKRIAVHASLMGAVCLAQAAKPEGDHKTAPAPVSTFLLPANPSQGRDPFFPESTRPYANVVEVHHAGSMASLTVRGFSGYLGDRTVIINNHSFAEGDEGDVNTPTGRVHIRCVTISQNSVIVEADHQRRILSFSSQ